MPTVQNKAAGRSRIVVLDGHTLNPGDLSWTRLRALGQVELYDRSLEDKIVERARKAKIVLVNKVVLDRPTLEQLPQLQCICVTASGYNNVDLETAGERNIPVCNAVGYGTESVAQHVFALLLELTNQVALHNKSVQEKEWTEAPDFSYTKKPIIELSGKTMGIYGLGRIGQKVADIAMAFGMDVIATHRHPERDQRPGLRFVELKVLFEKSDVISLHAPLSEENEGVVNKKLLKKMKPTAYLINTGRGGLIDESDLKEALTGGRIAGAALDVLTEEPPPEGHPLLGLDNCLITPHQAWASREARQRLMDITIENVKAFIREEPQNVVNEEFLLE